MAITHPEQYNSGPINTYARVATVVSTAPLQVALPMVSDGKTVERLASYTPAVDDVVLVLILSDQYIVLGTIA